MTKEDIELLLKDISARLLYEVKAKTPYNDAIIVGIVNRKGVRKDIDYIDIVTDKQTYPIKYIQPYLRPMSTMTEEERKYFQKLAFPYDFVDALNKCHFDYRGLIGKGLAIAVTKENNPYK